MELSLVPNTGKASKELDKARQDAIDRLNSGKTPEDKVWDKPGRGKKKQKYYNDIQFGGKSASEMKMK